jgi:four helix bundle protein
MEKENYDHWNQLVYYVSHVYSATKKFKPGRPGELGEKIRRTAVSLTAGINGLPRLREENPDVSRIYPIISSISVLETYLQIAKEHKLLKDTRELDAELVEVKEALYRLLADGRKD